jgi:hypothetical protein
MLLSYPIMLWNWSAFFSTLLGGRSQLRRVDEHQEESREDADRKEQEERKAEYETTGKSPFHHINQCSAQALRGKRGSFRATTGGEMMLVDAFSQVEQII